MRIISPLLFILYLCCSCQSPKGFPGASDNIDDAKMRGVFVARYAGFPNPMKINDTLSIRVNEAWLESKWLHTEDKEGAFIIDGYQLCINTNEKDIQNVTFDWNIGIDFDKNMRTSSRNSLIGDFKEIPGDTIEYKIQKGDNLSDNGVKIIIGKIALIKI